MKRSNTEEIKELEEALRLAELGPDPKFFEEFLDDDALLDGQKLKAKVVEAHRPGSQAPKFTRVVMDEFTFQDHGNEVVVTCKGRYEGPEWTGTLRFQRVWAKKDGGWRIIAGSTLR